MPMNAVVQLYRQFMNRNTNAKRVMIYIPVSNIKRPHHKHQHKY